MGATGVLQLLLFFCVVFFSGKNSGKVLLRPQVEERVVEMERKKLLFLTLTSVRYIYIYMHADTRMYTHTHLLVLLPFVILVGGRTGSML